VIQLLLTDVAIKNVNRETALYRAAMGGHEAIMRLLLKKEMDVVVKIINKKNGAVPNSERRARDDNTIIIYKKIDVIAKNINRRTILN
jgi:ankyrin repeat protein